MPDPSVPRKPGGGLWLPILGAIAGLYLALWGITWVFGLRAVRDLREGLPMNAAVGMLPLEHFDPADPPPAAPADPALCYYFVGNTFSPCPFVLSFDLVALSPEQRSASRMYAVWFFHLRNPFAEKTYWTIGK